MKKRKQTASLLLALVMACSTTLSAMPAWASDWKESLQAETPPPLLLEENFDGSSLNEALTTYGNAQVKDGALVLDGSTGTYPLRSYNGYQFRYVDSYIDGETGYIEVKDIGKVKWKDVIETGLKAVIPSILGGTAGTALSIGITLNDLISAAKVNPVMTYTYGAESYIKYNAVFRHYLRNIYINDKDNIIPGYDYYICGSSERAEIDSHVQSRWPTDSYSWVSSSGKVGLRQGITTPGFYGSVSVLPKFIQSYQLQRKYNESIELKRELIDFMLRF